MSHRERRQAFLSQRQAQRNAPPIEEDIEDSWFDHFQSNQTAWDIHQLRQIEEYRFIRDLNDRRGT
jgi:hypothetical protein